MLAAAEIIEGVSVGHSCLLACLSNHHETSSLQQTKIDNSQLTIDHLQLTVCHHYSINSKP